MSEKIRFRLTEIWLVRSFRKVAQKQFHSGRSKAGAGIDSVFPAFSSILQLFHCFPVPCPVFLLRRVKTRGFIMIEFFIVTVIYTLSLNSFF